MPHKEKVVILHDQVLSVAQLVEQVTLNHWVAGSNPAGETNSGCSAVGSVPRSGRGGRKFESSHPDERNLQETVLL